MRIGDYTYLYFSGRNGYGRVRIELKFVGRNLLTTDSSIAAFLGITTKHYRKTLIEKYKGHRTRTNIYFDYDFGSTEQQLADDALEWVQSLYLIRHLAGVE